MKNYPITKSSHYIFSTLKIEYDVPIPEKAKDFLKPYRDRFQKLLPKLKNGATFVLPFHHCIVKMWAGTYYHLTARQETINTWRYWLHIPEFNVGQKVTILSCANSLVINGSVGTIDAICKDGYWVLTDSNDYLKNTSTSKQIKVFVETTNLRHYECA